MHAFSTPVALAAIAAVPAVYAHGYISGVAVNGNQVDNQGTNPSWNYQSEKPERAGWYAENTDNGFVGPESYGDADIICHKGASPGKSYIELNGGDSLDLQWTEWPESHHGPVIDYMARCNGDCSQVNKENLNFFKLDATGLIDGSSTPGRYGDDKLIDNNNTWTVQIPEGLSGNFVLRHEIIALHSAGSEGGAQNYPQCLNLKIGGGGTDRPCDNGADCRHGTELYKKDDDGIVFNIYEQVDSYPIPGPKKWAQSAAKRFARAFRA